MITEAWMAEPRPPAPDTYPPGIGSADYQVEFFAGRPGLAEECVRIATEEWPTPDQFAAAVVAMQREAVSSDDFSGLHKHAEKIEERLAPERQRMLDDVASGHPSAVNLQIVLWSASQTSNAGLRVFKPAGAGKLAERHGSISSIPMFEVAEGETQLPIRRALRDYVINNPEHGERFNPGAPHIYAIAQVDLMRMIGVFKELHVDVESGVRDAMINMATGFLDHTRKAGDYTKLPLETWEAIQSLIAFREDRELHLAGDSTIAQKLNRPYHALGGPEAIRRYTTYLTLRSNVRKWSNNTYIKQFDKPADEIGDLLARAISDATQQASPKEQIIAMERLGRYWAIAAMRRTEPEMAPIVERHNLSAKRLLETYVKDGLPLITSTVAPRWMWDIVIDGWSDNDPRSSIFTEQHGSKVNDRAEVGEYLSDWVREYVVKQGKLNYIQDEDRVIETESMGYGWSRKELGLVVAHRLFAEAVVMWRAGTIDKRSGVYGTALDRMQRLKYEVRSEFESMGRSHRLPQDVWDTYDSLPAYHPRVLRAANALRRVVGWTSEK